MKLSQVLPVAAGLFITLASSANSFAKEITLAESPSDDRIDDAVEHKILTFEQGWKFKILARFHPEQLPEPYRPVLNPESPPESRRAEAGVDNIFSSLASTLPTLSAEAQSELIGYFIPPIYAGSKLPGAKLSASEALPKILDDSPPTLPLPFPQSGWKSIESSDIKVWWEEVSPKDEASAQLIISLFSTVKSKLDAAMKRTYISDAGIHRFRNPKGEWLEWGDGGNGKLDIYLISITGSELAFTVPYPPGCSERPSFILIDNGIARMEGGAEATLAHEYLHVLQSTFVHGHECPKYDRVDEGTANWAIKYVFPKNWWPEFRYNLWFHYGDYSLLSESYRSWPFYVFVEHALGVDTIRQIFDQYALQYGIEAVNFVLPGNLAKQFPEYTLHEWNQTDTVDDFRDWINWDEVPWEDYKEPIKKVSVKADGNGNFLDSQDVELQPLTRKYFHYVFDDPAIRSVGIEAITAFDSTQVGRLKALVKRHGEDFKVEDWSSKEDTTEFCRDVEKERIEEIVLIFSNVDYKGVKEGGKVYHNALTVEATNLACYTWQGKFTAEVTRQDSQAYDDLQTSSHADFERVGVNETGNFKGRFQVTSGAGSYSYVGKRISNGQVCHGNAAGAFQIVKNTAANALGLYPHQVGTPNARYYLGAFAALEPRNFDVTYYCPNGASPVYDSVTLAAWDTGFKRLQADSNGNLIGNGVVRDGKFNWDIRPKP